MYINSAGVTKSGGKLGYEVEALAIYDTMRHIKPPVSERKKERREKRNPDLDQLGVSLVPRCALSFRRERERQREHTLEPTLFLHRLSLSPPEESRKKKER